MHGVTDHLRRKQASRAFVLIYVTIAMAVLLMLCSLAVDYGRVQLTKTQLQRMADAAARYGSSGLSDGTYFAKAQAAVTDNSTDVGTLTLQSSDVVIGSWAGGTFTANGSPKNAIEVIAQCTTARGNPVPLLFAQVLGTSSCDVTATGYAEFNSQPGYLFAGVHGVYFQNGTIKTDSYNSSTGAYSAAAAGTYGMVATNGGVTLTGGVTISEGLYMLAGQTITQNGSPNYGGRINMSTGLTYTAPSAGTISTNNNNNSLAPALSGGNFNMSSGTLNVPAGNYYMNSFNMSGGTININGAANFYVNGNFSVSGGSINVLNNIPSNFAVNVCASAGANITTSSNLYINLYAPTSPINISNGPSIFGRMVGSTLNVSGSALMHADTALGGTSSSGTVSLVH